MKIALHELDGSVMEATYETYQYPDCHACGKALCDMVAGKSLDHARTIKHSDLLAKVGPLLAHRRISTLLPFWCSRRR